MSIGQRIRAKRKEMGMSVDELAARLGKDRSTVYRYEKGDIENLPLDVLEPIANALNTTPAALMGWVTEESGQRTTELAQLYKRMRLDDDFYRMVQKLDKLSETQLDSIKQLLNAFFPDK